LSIFILNKEIEKLHFVNEKNQVYKTYKVLSTGDSTAKSCHHYKMHHPETAGPLMTEEKHRNDIS
jgi:hypothetical protein